MSENDNGNKSLEVLFWEINNSILNSIDVQKLIVQLERARKLDSVSEYNLVLDVGLLVETILKQQKQNKDDNNLIEALKNQLLASFEEEGQQLSPNLMKDSDLDTADEIIASEHVSKEYTSQRIDGKSLSENEIQFQEFANSRFDEDSWLKKAKICFED